MNESLEPKYAARLQAVQGAWWKRLLDVQRPYRNHLRKLRPGFMLEVGCGVGRNLAHVDGNGIGIEPNKASAEICGARGFTVLSPDEFEQSAYAQGACFDTLLFSHVLEHMRLADTQALVQRYVPRIKPGGRLILVTPQEAGFRSDATHVTFTDLSALREIAHACGLTPQAAYSFPFPRIVGRFFRYNEFVLIAMKNS